MSNSKSLQFTVYSLRLWVVVLLTFNFSLLIFCQPITNSPYSRYGLGDIQYSGFAHNISMGGICNALQNDTTAPFNINISNPASLASLKLTVFDLGMKNNTTQLETSDKKFTSNRTALSYMALAFPVAKWWGASFGLLPYSSVGYKIYNKKDLDTIGTVNYSYEGEGGINQAYLGNGFKIKNFYVGVNVSYLFGDMAYYSRDSFPKASNFLNTKVSQTTRVSDMYFSSGIQYHQVLKKGWSVTLGATGSLSSNIKVKKTTFAATYKNDFGVEVLKDTIINDEDVKDAVTIPMMLGGGLVFKKGDKWLFGFDYSMQKWSEFKSFGQDTLLKDSQKMSFGMQYTPNKTAGSKEPYYKKISYRAGFRSADSYLDLERTPFKDYAITFGVGLPLRKNKIIGQADNSSEQKYFQSAINLGFEIGQRGTTQKNLIRERYVNAFISFTLNDKWFIKRKYD
jgi:hypothetical protein